MSAEQFARSIPGSNRRYDYDYDYDYEERRGEGKGTEKRGKAAALGVQINTDPISCLALSDAACTVIDSYSYSSDPSILPRPLHQRTDTNSIRGNSVSSISIFLRGSYAGKAPMSRRKWLGIRWSRGGWWEGLLSYD